jgi:hypothetical protein
MSHMSRIPVWVTVDLSPAERPGMALIQTGRAASPPGYAVLRHAEAAAIAEAGGCVCCRTPSNLVTLLRQLFLERVRGETNFVGIVIEGPPALIDPALADPLVAARYVRVES